MTLPSSQHKDVSVLIPAAGRGERLGLGPKALLELNGLPLLTWVIRKALQITDDVVVTAPQGQIGLFQELCSDCRVIDGGSTRQDSVSRLVDNADRPFVLIHDVARPFASINLFNRVITKAREVGCAGAFLEPDIPVAIIENNLVVRDFQRNQVGIFQAPQCFSRELLLDVLKQAKCNNWQEQSTLQLVLRAKKAVGTVYGEKNNIKLTTPEDWQIAQFLMEYL
jgi:2-C-methyl-D-erythritol 4-phosphate cytidylyltransferase